MENQVGKQYEKIHSHRNIIGFDQNGIPTVILKSDHQHDEEDPAAFIKDYTNAVSAYRKTFPSKEDVIDQTPDPAVRELLIRESELGIENTFDRFDQQKPQCTFGLAGTCCKNCNMGPCRITAKAPRGICGADADLIVARNLCRSSAGGTAQHGAHGREVMLELKWAAEGKLDIPLIGKQKIISTANAFGIKTKNRQLKYIAKDLAEALLADLSNTDPDKPYQTLYACGSPERVRIWEDLDIIPVSAYHETAESLHRTCVGNDGDWRSVMQQFLRNGLAFTFSGVVGTSIATDALFGVGDRVTAMTNTGALKKNTVNIAVHGHLPLLVNQIVAVGKEPAYIEKAKAAGADGIQFYGICCSGLSAMFRYDGVIPLSNAVSAELVLGTGALDLWVADVQDVFPGIMNVANCFKTTVVTTSDSARLPGAERYEFDHHHTNVQDAKKIAEKIVDRAIESYTARRDVPVNIPEYQVEAEVGFSIEYLAKRFGSLRPIAEAIRGGQILGMVNMVGCSNPKVPFERCIADITKTLIENNVIVLTNGCASYPLMKLGYCARSGKVFAGRNLQGFLGEDLPPVWHVGECIDNTRSTQIFAAIASELQIPLQDMPFAMSSPEWGNEKGIDAALAFRLNGINSYHCVEAPIFGSQNVTEFLKHGSRELLGSVMTVDVDPVSLAHRIIDDMKEKRQKLGWDS